MQYGWFRFSSVQFKSVSRLLPVSDRMYPCEKDVIISLLFSFNFCLVLHYRYAVYFYGLCLDNSRSISGQKMPSQFEIAWLVKSHWYTWNISFPPFRFLKTGGKTVGVFLMSFHRLNGSRKKRNFFLFIEALNNLPKFKVQLIFITDFSFNCWRTIWDIDVFNF